MSEMERLERLAERLRAVDPVMPSPGAKIRGWNLVLAAVEQSATARKRTHPVRRLVLAAVAAAVLLVAGAVAASADSLPDSALYPLKGVVENVRGALAFSPSDKLAYHLDLARTRLTEAEAMIARHRLDLAGQALSGMNDQLNEAALVVQSEQQSDPALAASLENRLVQAIATHDQQLAGLQGQVTNPTAVAAITQARDRAAQALQTSSGKPSASPGNGKGPSNSPHPTPKH
ncbi:MAG TPA: DUF5667 domain-containing protein [Candidatus Acidoferrum sp.]|nr:DUF5667 domain-containing protein [Candidatus Acidoferrum sp.]